MLRIPKSIKYFPKDIGKELSVYGSQDFGEFFAEAIAEYEKHNIIQENWHVKSIRRYEELNERGSSQMIMIPDEKIMKYVSTNERGEWIHDPQMPEELIPLFNDFVEKSQKAKSESYHFS